MKLLAVLVLVLGSAMIVTAVDSSSSKPPQDRTPVQQAKPAGKLTDDKPIGGVVPPLELGPQSLAGSAWQKPRAHSEPHGHELCASGCAVSHHPTKRLSKTECRELLRRFQRDPVEHDSDALDALLYYGAQTQFRLRDEELRKLIDTQHLEVLEQELARGTAVVSIRLLDEMGAVRAELPATKAPQHVRQVFDLDEFDMQPLVCSGTVKRVGKDHIWQRL